MITENHNIQSSHAQTPLNNTVARVIAPFFFYTYKIWLRKLQNTSTTSDLLKKKEKLENFNMQNKYMEKTSCVNNGNKLEIHFKEES